MCSYSVAVNSSVLGADADGYHHHYLDVRYHTRPQHFFRPNIGLHNYTYFLLYIIDGADHY